MKLDFSPDRLSKNPQITDVTKIQSMGAGFCVDGRTVRLTDMTKLRITYCNFLNVLKNSVPNSQKSLKRHYIDQPINDVHKNEAHNCTHGKKKKSILMLKHVTYAVTTVSI